MCVLSNIASYCCSWEWVTFVHCSSRKITKTRKDTVWTRWLDSTVQLYWLKTIIIHFLSTSNWQKLTNVVTWDQALFLFCFVNNIPAGKALFLFTLACWNVIYKAKQKYSLIQTFYKTSTTHFFDWLTFAESANKNYFRSIACSFSM